MRILYEKDEGLVVTISKDDPDMLLATVKALIGAFEGQCDVSFLRWVLKEATSDFTHTLQ